MAALKYPFLKRREDNESQVKGSSIKACPSKRKKSLNKTIIRSGKKNRTIHNNVQMKLVGLAYVSI